MIALFTVVVVALVSLLIARVATTALTLTGLSHEAARFQARSALSGTGFTTNEAESVVNHPVRRRVVMTLMLLGSAGLVTAVATLIITFGNADRTQAFERLAVLALALLAVYLLSRSAVVDRWLARVIATALRRLTDLDARDYAQLLHVGGDFAVSEVAVCGGDWFDGRRLGDLRLRDEGVVALGLEHADGEYLGAPHFDTVIEPGMTLVLYGRRPKLAELARRERDDSHGSAPAAGRASRAG
jgi:K+/H+ antiporter YhaU regulatory subunit KhtT